MEIDRNLPVLITGATGYVAGWVAKHFLEKGFTVHAAIRDAENKTKRQHLDQIANNCVMVKSNFLNPIFSMRVLTAQQWKDAKLLCILHHHFYWRQKTHSEILLTLL